MAEHAEIKKPIYKKWWFWLIVVIVVVAITSGGNSDDSSKTTLSPGGSNTSSDNNSTTNNTKTTYNVGEIFENSNVAIKYVSLDDNFKNYSQYATVKSGCKVIKAEFEFENLGTTDFLASSYNFNCYADGYDCEAFWSVDDSTFSSTLSSGKKAKGAIYFQVPENATTVNLEYELNAWTSEKIEFVVK